MAVASETLDHSGDSRYTTSGALHVPAGEGPTTWFSGDTYTIKASHESTNGSLGLVEATVPPGGGPIAHAHTRADEAFYVLSGELEILDGARTFVARAGDFVFIPRGIRHRFKNTGLQSARMLFLFTPGGEEGVFVYGDEAQPGHPPPAWSVERFMTPEILRFNEEFGVEILPEAADNPETVRYAQAMLIRSRPIALLIAALALPLAAATVTACGGDDDSGKTMTGPARTSATTVAVASTGGLGEILVDSRGRTMYLFAKDTGTRRACSGACASDWPPVTTEGKPTVGDGLSTSKVGTTKRADGTTQLTYNGHPLYPFRGDQGAGDANGQGLNAFGAAWYVLSPAGNQITASAPGSVGGGGGY